jgi:hypothetical protein
MMQPVILASMLVQLGRFQVGNFSKRIFLLVLDSQSAARLVGN